MAGDADATAREVTPLTDPDNPDGEDAGIAATDSMSGEPEADDASMTDVDELTTAGEETTDATHCLSPLKSGLLFAAVTIIAIGALAGWLGYHSYQDHLTEHRRNLLFQVARQGAVNLTTINYTEADADVQRILDSSTGTFRDDFERRAPALIEVVKQAQSRTEGSITDAGLESFSGDSARLLVAVSVKTSNITAADQQPRQWRMRIDVKLVGDGAKVSDVGFVP